jgi:aspartate/methionine/tyrosine aminotransferase
MSSTARRSPRPRLPENTRLALEIYEGAWGPRRAAARRTDVINLSSGDPSFVTPEHIREAAIRAIREGRTHYERSHDLHEAIAEKLRRDNDIAVDPRRGVVITPGAHQALFLTMRAYVGPGDEVIMATPGSYYEANVLAAGGAPVLVPLRRERGFRLDPAEVAARITARTTMICITNPEAPATTVWDRRDLQTLAEVAIRHNLVVVSDELYEKINYGAKPHVSLAGLPGMEDRTITINGVSKCYAMTGWRAGYAAGPAALIEPVAALAHMANISIAAPSYWAAVAALHGPQDCVAEMVAEYHRKTKRLVEGANAIDGVTVPMPEGTYYAWADVGALGTNSLALTRLALAEFGLNLIPGSAFGIGGEGFVRLSCTPTDDQIEEGLRRLARLAARVREEAAGRAPATSGSPAPIGRVPSVL